MSIGPSLCLCTIWCCEDFLGSRALLRWYWWKPRAYEWKPLRRVTHTRSAFTHVPSMSPLYLLMLLRKKFTWPACIGLSDHMVQLLGEHTCPWCRPIFLPQKFLEWLNCSQTFSFRVAEVTLWFAWKFHIHLSWKCTSYNLRFMGLDKTAGSHQVVFPVASMVCVLCSLHRRLFWNVLPPVLLISQLVGPVAERAAVSESLLQ